MEFRILGPLEVLRDGESVRLPGKVQPRLLAVLLLEAGRVVPLGRIVEAVWDADPPATARRQAQNNAALLRNLLDGSIEAVGEGYKVHVDADQLDARRFERVVRVSHEQTETGDHKRALETLETGLKLWRGSALAGLSGRLIESGAARLDEAHVAAIEERVDLQLRLGRTQHVIGELRELLTQHPFRERLTGQLMLALYWAGHGGEALEVYETARSRLAEELGVDAGQQLRDLHAAVLREDPTLNAPGPQPDLAAPGAGNALALPVPAQLPAGTTAFTGRDEQLAKLDELLEDGGGTAVLSTVAGIGGVGKTALAVHWGHQRRDRFPDGQLYVNLRGFDRGEPVAPKEALSRFLRALGHPGDAIPDTLDEAAALYHSLLADKQMLVVLDNARDVTQARPLLPSSSGSFALVTSRNRLAGLTSLDDAHPIRLDTLNPSDSLELLANLLGAQRLYAEPAAARRLAELCGRLPLALRIAAANLAAQPRTELADYVAELEGAGRLKLLTVEGDPDAAVAAAFDLSYRILDPDTQDLFLKLGLIPGHDFASELAAVVSDTSETDAEQLLNRLESAHLLEQHEPGRYRFHDLVKDYAKQQADLTLDDSKREMTRDRVIASYVDRSNSLPSIEYDNVVAAFQTWRQHPPALHLTRTLAIFADEGHDVAAVRRHVNVGLQIARQHDDTDGLYHVARALTIIYYHSGDYSSAIEYGRKVVELASSDDLAVRNNLGTYLSGAGQYAEAEKWLREALHIAERTERKEHQVIVLDNLGGVCRAQSKFCEAEAHLKRSIRLADEMSKTSSQTRNRITLFDLYLDLGRLDECSRLLEEIKRTPEASQVDRKQVHVLLAQGKLYERTGRYSSGKLALTQALELARDSSRLGVAREIQDVLAEVLSDSGQHRSALTCLSPRAGDQHDPLLRDTARRALVHCKIHARLGEYQQALRYGVQARNLHAAMPNPLRHARSLAALADAHAGLGDFEAARECREEALGIFTRLGVPEARQLQALLETP